LPLTRLASTSSTPSSVWSHPVVAVILNDCVMIDFVKKIAALLLVGVFLLPVVVLADELPTLEDIRKPLETVGGSEGIGFDTEELSRWDALAVLTGQIIQYVMAFIGVVLAVIIVYAGYLWLTAGGNEEQVTKAKTLLKNAVIGLAIVFTAAIISAFILDALALGVYVF